MRLVCALRYRLERSSQSKAERGGSESDAEPQLKGIISTGEFVGVKT